MNTMTTKNIAPKQIAVNRAAEGSKTKRKGSKVSQNMDMVRTDRPWAARMPSTRPETRASRPISRVSSTRIRETLDRGIPSSR